jgi:hypothetical protein
MINVCISALLVLLASRQLSATRCPWAVMSGYYSANPTDKAILNPRFELLGDQMSQYRTRKAIQYIHRYFRASKNAASANDGMLSGMRFVSETAPIGRDQVLTSS